MHSVGDDAAPDGGGLELSPLALARLRLADAHVRTRALARHLRAPRPRPRRHELRHLDPSRVREVVPGFHQGYSAEVRTGDWDLDRTDVEDLPAMRFARLHWQDGVPWEETGAYDYVLERTLRRGTPFDGCRNLDDIVARYAELDRLFEQVRAERRLRTQRELRRWSFRESGGVYIHVDRAGEPLFSAMGHHRLAIAKILALPTMPVAIGLVHESARHDWQAVFEPPRAPSAPS